MLNLLSKDQKNKIIREYRVRFWVILLALFFVAEAISLILLVPPYLTTQIRISLLNSESAGLQVQNLNTESSNLSDTVKQTNNYLSVFNSTSTPVGVTAALQKIIDVRGKEVRIGGFLYRANSGQMQFVVSGNADSRQSLQDFTNNLKSQPNVVSADLPVSDFAQAQNIDFSINVVMNPQHI